MNGKIKWSHKQRKKGGMTIGIMPKDAILTSEDEKIKIEVDCFDSQLKNKQLAYNVYQLALETLNQENE